MLENIILFSVCILMGFFIICAFLIAEAEKKERKKNEKELKEVKEHEEQTAEIITEANKTKADARTGDHSADIKYMADKLHDYANR